MTEYYAAIRSKGLHSSTQKVLAEGGALSHMVQATQRQVRNPREKSYSTEQDTQLSFTMASPGEKFLGQSVARWIVGCAQEVHKVCESCFACRKTGPNQAVEKKVQVLAAQLYPTFCDSCSPPASLTMEFSRQEYWSRQPFLSRVSFRPRDQTQVTFP